MKTTKSAKSIKVEWTKVERDMGKYTCPSCKTMFMDLNLMKNVEIFYCSYCGQKLKIEGN
jgi:predicted SprT family Zn-dependent metalloprotease